MSIVDAVQMKASTTASPAARDSTLGLGEAIFCRKKHDSNSKFEGSFATRWLVVQPKDYARGAGGTVVLCGRPSNFSLHSLALHKFEHRHDRKILGANNKLPLTILLISFLAHGDVYFGVTEFECADCG
jgi:hypothetical protein